MSDDSINPYASTPSPATAASTSSKRSRVPMVIGIISLVFAAIAALGVIAQTLRFASQGLPSTAAGINFPPGWYVAFGLVLGFLMAVILLASGLNLMKYRHSGRRLFSIYLVLAIISSVRSGVMGFRMLLELNASAKGLPPGIGEGATFGDMIAVAVGMLLVLAFPVIGYILLNRSATRASLS